MATKEEIREGLAETSYYFENRGKEYLKWGVLASEYKLPYYEFADVILCKQDSQGVAIKVEGELPLMDEPSKTFYENNKETPQIAQWMTGYITGRQDMLKAGYTAWEPLIEVKFEAKKD